MKIMKIINLLYVVTLITLIQVPDLKTSDIFIEATLWNQVQKGCPKAMFIFSCQIGETAKSSKKIADLEKSLFWFHLGTLRLCQDTACYNKSKVINKIAEDLVNECKDYLDEILGECLQEIFKEELSEFECNQKKQTKIYEIANKLNKKAFKDAFDSLKKYTIYSPPFFAGKKFERSLRPKSQWNEIYISTLKQIVKNEKFKEFFD